MIDVRTNNSGILTRSMEHVGVPEKLADKVKKAEELAALHGNTEDLVSLGKSYSCAESIYSKNILENRMYIGEEANNDRDIYRNGYIACLVATPIIAGLIGGPVASLCGLVAAPAVAFVPMGIGFGIRDSIKKLIAEKQLSNLADKMIDKYSLSS